MEFKLNNFERLISIVSPKTALQRAQYRMAMDLMSERGYDAAALGRRANSWGASASSANKETERDLARMRFRSRDLVRNNPYAKRAIQAMATNVVGTGIRPTPKGLDDASQKAIKELWDGWAESTACDYEGQTNLYGLQSLAAHCVAESGEVIIRRRIVQSADFPLQLQVLEPDFLDHNKNSIVGFGEGRSKDNYTIQGVEFNKEGKRVGYWLYPVHPGEGVASVSQFVSADDILHVYVKTRPGQVRGVPQAHASVSSLYDFSEYEQAQLVRQKVAACFSVFISGGNGAGLPGQTGGTQAAKDRKKEQIEPGIIQYMNAGEQVSFAAPPGTQNYDEYATSILRKAAVGIGVSYEVLSGDLSNVNFSSGRMGWIEFHRLITQLQMHTYVPMMAQPIWDWFVAIAIVLGKAKTGIKVTWTPPRREMIDPAKEIAALSEAVRNGFDSWSNVVTQFGGDPRTVLQQIVKDFEEFKAAGLMLACDPRYDVSRKIDINGNPLDGSAATDEKTGKQAKAKNKKEAQTQ